MPHIYVLTPDNNKASGGVKILYRHVDVLNRSGFSASVLHAQSGFRCNWFDNITRVEYLADVTVRECDFLVIPEIYGPRTFDVTRLPQISPAARKVIFNQNCYYTFLGHSVASVLAAEFVLPYAIPQEYVATIVVSEDSQTYLRYAYPKATVFRIHNAIGERFTYSEAKQRQICFMPRKHPEDAVQVLGLLRARAALRDFQVVSIEGLDEAGVAAVMRDSMFFLSFGYPEGCPLPPAEAMASGCVVAGYDGLGGSEYFKPDFSFPVPIGDIIGFADSVERLIQTADKDPGRIRAWGNAASRFVRETYSSRREKDDIVGIWSQLLA